MMLQSIFVLVALSPIAMAPTEEKSVSAAPASPPTLTETAFAFADDASPAEPEDKPKTKAKPKSAKPPKAQAVDSPNVSEEPKAPAPKPAKPKTPRVSKPKKIPDWKKPEFLQLFQEPTLKYTGRGYQDREFRYRLFVPELSPGEKYPLLIWLHGYGQGGDDNAFHLCYINDYVLPAPWERSRYPYFVLAIQGPKDNQVWMTGDPNADDMLNVVMAALDKTIDEYPVDELRISVTGISSGGSGCWELGIRHPDKFSCLAPLGGGVRSNTERAGLLTGVPVWAFNIPREENKPPTGEQLFVDAINAAGGSAKLTEVDAEDHYAWHPAFKNFDLKTWLLSQKRP